MLIFSAKIAKIEVEGKIPGGGEGITYFIKEKVESEGKGNKILDSLKIEENNQVRNLLLRF